MIDTVLKLLPLKVRIFIYFYLKHGYFMSWSKPELFSEYIQLRKLRLGKKESVYADKYAVRKYVEEKIGTEYLIPLIGVYEKLGVDDVDTSRDDIVIKTNHGSGSAHLEIFPTDKTAKEISDKFNSALMQDYRGVLLGEVQYKYIDRRVVVEKKIGINGEVPEDFKFHVFRNGGNPIWILQVDFDRFTDHKRNYYDSELNQLDYQVIYKNGNYQLPNSKELNKMAELAIALLGDSEYMRVDLYLVGGQIYFGELTLTPGNGFEAFSSREAEAYWGELYAKSLF
ncbi:ATP-grasp fold amidoligase family protein [Pseudoalteromonas ardens]|uniref:ATP-grasp fold amidoligase family protein n=1 Tax=Pseudoalteromonas ardens TaxID=3048490 RepID=UPI0024C38ED5|nr:ATP-grasp fold amidoligase family protein [Pseudoalteromonas sp. R96]MDK1312552.1 ATP-grasp fold amidoligase family protein [Pseudoalteromonas sp. R96]